MLVAAVNRRIGWFLLLSSAGAVVISIVVLILLNNQVGIPFERIRRFRAVSVARSVKQ
jgi:hypothetical protein